MLTEDSKTVLYVLYQEYLSRRKYGFSKRDSKSFRSEESIHVSFFSDWSPDDVSDCLRELDRNGFLDTFYSDGEITLCNLSDYAIATLENQPRETFLSVAEFISKFIP